MRHRIEHPILWGLLLVGLLFAVPAEAQTPCSQVTNAVTVDQENITTTVNWVNTNAYVLEDIVEVKDGGVLNIQEGTCIFGNTDQEPSALVVRRGGQINADGTSSQPIIFSSANNDEFLDIAQLGVTGAQTNPGAPAAGDWGGLVIIGNANCNGANDDTPGPDPDGVPGDCEVEGLNDQLVGIESAEADATDADGVGRLTFGGNSGIPGAQGLDPAESSGTLRNVRVEYAGFDLGDAPGNPEGSGNELNVLTLFAVGSGTTIENVHVKEGTDDGFELFGGSVNIKNAVATLIQDDSFDYSYGWDGFAQFVLIQQTVGSSDKGFEVDNNEAENGDEAVDYALTPLTSPNIFNVTLIGDNGGQMFRLRRGTGGTIQNGLASGFEEAIDTDDEATFANCTSGDLLVDNFTVSDGTDGAVVGSQFAADPDPDGTTQQESDCVGSGFGQGLTALSSSSQSRSDPAANFQPVASSPNVADPGTVDPFFDPAPFQGAINPNGTPFYLNGTWARFENTASNAP
jgi:hypothetical protein